MKNFFFLNMIFQKKNYGDYEINKMINNQRFQSYQIRLMISDKFIFKFIKYTKKYCLDRFLSINNLIKKPVIIYFQEILKNIPGN